MTAPFGGGALAQPRRQTQRQTQTKDADFRKTAQSAVHRLHAIRTSVLNLLKSLITCQLLEQLPVGLFYLALL